MSLEPAAGCTAVSVTHSLPGRGEAEADDDEDHNPYRDLVADYVFECSEPASLASLSFPIFQPFSHLEALDVVILMGDRQIAETLTASDSTLSLD